MNPDLPLGVLGAGPKGLAIAAKACVLRELGFNVPSIVLVEKARPGAAWSGAIGYTDGLQPLGTSPEKDVGFPYLAKYSDPALTDKHSQIDAAMQRFSWQAFQIAAGRFQTWIDRGRPAPLHKEWAEYLGWVAKSVIRAGHVELVEGNVSQISIADNAWSLSLENQSIPRLFQGLVITGTGDAKKNIEVHPKVADRVLDGRTFWSKLPDFAQADQEPTSGRIDVTIIGSGETAGSVAAALTKLNTRVTIISKDGIIFSRGETFQENALYSKPDEWQKYSHQFRKEFISRTDRGVFSQKVKLDVDRCERIGYEAGRVRLLHERKDGARQIVYETETSENETSIRKREFDWVVIATGFNPMSFASLLDDNARARLLETVGQLTGDSVAKTVDRHLSVGGLQPRLHLPMLAGFAQGPGFPNLSCLGTLSDRILESYVSGLTGAKEASATAREGEKHA